MIQSKTCKLLKKTKIEKGHRGINEGYATNSAKEKEQAIRYKERGKAKRQRLYHTTIAIAPSLNNPWLYRFRQTVQHPKFHSSVNKFTFLSFF